MNTPGAQLKSAILQRFGPSKGRVGLVKKFRAVKSAKRVRFLLARYFEEESKSASVPLASASDPAYAGLIVSGDAPQRPGIDFIAGERPGLRVYGFLNEWIDRRMAARSQAPRKDMIETLSHQWMRARGEYATKAHHLVFSIDPRVPPDLSALGVPIDSLMDASVVESLLAFNNRFFPDNTLGWAHSLHHDRHHVHLHLLLFPRTSNGRPLPTKPLLSDGLPLNVSDHSAVRVGGKLVHVDYQSFISSVYGESLQRRVGVARALRFRNLEVCRAGVAEVCGGLATVYEALSTAERELPGADRAKLFAGRWQQLVIDPSALRQINAALPRLAADEGRTPVTVAALDARLELFRKSLATCQAEVDRLRRRKQEVADAFSQWRTSRARYEPVRYTPCAPPLSPSGSLQYLGYARDIFPRPMPAPRDIEARVTERLAELDRLIELHARQIQKGPATAPSGVETQFIRCLYSVYAAFPILAYALRLRGLPPLCADVPTLKQLTAKPLTTAMSDVKASVCWSAGEVARLNRTATVKDLLRIAEVRRSVQAPIGQPDPVDVPDVDLPNVIPTVPATPNFLEREHSLPKGVRNIAELDAELQQALERLSRVKLAPEFSKIAYGPPDI